MRYTPKEYLLRKCVLNQQTDCWEWVGSFFNSGYGSASFNYKTHLAHRLSFEIFVGPIGNNHVLHICDNPKCINPKHLFLGNHADNMSDKVNKNRQYRPKGVSHTGAKLSEEIIRKIRASDKKNSELAKEYDIDRAQISRIRNNKAWAHIK